MDRCRSWRPTRRHSSSTFHSWKSNLCLAGRSSTAPTSVLSTLEAKNGCWPLLRMDYAMVCSSEGKLHARLLHCFHLPTFPHSTSQSETSQCQDIHSPTLWGLRMFRYESNWPGKGLKLVWTARMNITAGMSILQIVERYVPFLQILEPNELGTPRFIRESHTRTRRYLLTSTMQKMHKYCSICAVPTVRFLSLAVFSHFVFAFDVWKAFPRGNVRLHILSGPLTL